jgi:hypothetical protein
LAAGVLADGVLFASPALAVARKHTLGCLKFAELAGEHLALRIDARGRGRLADPLLITIDATGATAECVDLFGSLIDRRGKPLRG